MSNTGQPVMDQASDKVIKIFLQKDAPVITKR